MAAIEQIVGKTPSRFDKYLEKALVYGIYSSTPQ
jgi:hypothetical protein